MRRVAALVVVTLAHPAFADEPPVLREGSRVRIATESKRGTIRATLAALDDQRLTLETKPGAAPVVVERSRITKLELSAGRRSRGRGAGIGALVGLGIGLAFTGVVAASEDCEGYGSEDCGLGTAISLLFFTPTLTVTGALVGVALPPSERWVSVPPVKGSVGGAKSRAALRVTVRF